MGKAVELAKRYRVFFIFLFCAFALSACAYQPPSNFYDPPGFFLGLLHGYIIFFSLIGSVFMDIRVYAFPNSGFFYDLGYAIGVLLSTFSLIATAAS